MTEEATFAYVKRQLSDRVPVSEDTANASASSTKTPAQTKEVGKSAASGFSSTVAAISGVTAAALMAIVYEVRAHCELYMQTNMW